MFSNIKWGSYTWVTLRATVGRLDFLTLIGWCGFSRPTANKPRQLSLSTTKFFNLPTIAWWSADNRPFVRLLIKLICDFLASVSIHGLYVVVGLSVCTADSHHQQSADSQPTVDGVNVTAVLVVRKKKNPLFVWGWDKKILPFSITVCHHSASLVMPISDPRDWFFYPTITLTMDPYSHK